MKMANYHSLLQFLFLDCQACFDAAGHNRKRYDDPQRIHKHEHEPKVFQFDVGVKLWRPVLGREKKTYGCKNENRVTVYQGNVVKTIPHFAKDIEKTAHKMERRREKSKGVSHKGSLLFSGIPNIF